MPSNQDEINFSKMVLGMPVLPWVLCVHQVCGKRCALLFMLIDKRCFSLDIEIFNIYVKKHSSACRKPPC